MLTRDEAIKTAMRKWMKEPFEWGKSDCMLSVADYLIDAVGADCGGQFRGKYANRKECARLSGYMRDPVKPFAACVAEIPLQETTEPKKGDVGVIHMAGETVGAVCLGDKWAARADPGLFISTPTKILKAWAV
jgi:hypothetical protein